MDIRLIRPQERFLQSYCEACASHGEKAVQHGLPNPDDFSVWRNTLLQRFADAERGQNLPENYVPMSTFWLVEGDSFIAQGDIRHRLTPALERFGGHIGYIVRKDRWGRGYGKALLGMLLPEAAALGIENALVTCDESNIASAKIIEANGGILQDIIENTIETGAAPRRTKRYWIATGGAKQK